MKVFESFGSWPFQNYVVTDQYVEVQLRIRKISDNPHLTIKKESREKLPLRSERTPYQVLYAQKEYFKVALYFLSYNSHKKDREGLVLGSRMGVGFQPEVGLELLCPWFFLCF